ncbi:MAG TPA: sortase [Candidatus Methanoperedens sp.]|nr:sortase [Candidatus Methanoperedens sp.]
MLNFFRVVPKHRNVRIKKNSGLIFSNPSGGKKVIFYIANMLLFSAIIYCTYLYTPLISAVLKYKTAKPEIKTNIIVDEQVSDKYVIQIPKILAYSQVVENVSPFDKAEYDRVLKNNVVAQAKDTDKPGSGAGSSIYIFAHSTNNNLGMLRSNAVFYLLGELQNEDIIYINYQQKELKYRVFDKKVAPPTDLSYLEYHNPEKEVLILQTCWPIGTDWNRLLILAEYIP